MEVENNYNNDHDYTEDEDITEDIKEDIKEDITIIAKIEMLLFLYQTNGSFTNNNYYSIDDLKEDTTNKIYNLLSQQLIFYNEYDIAFNGGLRDAVKYHVDKYFNNN